jgi:hypothetical protein
MYNLLQKVHRKLIFDCLLLKCMDRPLKWVSNEELDLYLACMEIEHGIVWRFVRKIEHFVRKIGHV